MASALSSLFVDWYSVCLTVTAFLVTWWLWTTFTSRRRLPPGPFPWPLLGNLPAIMTQPDFCYEYFRKLSLDYGSLLYVRGGTFEAVVVNGYEGFKKTFMTFQTELAGRPHFVTGDLLSDGGQTIALGSYGPAWSLHRKLAMTALRHFASKDTLTELVNSELTDCVQRMQEGEAVDIYDNLYDVLYGVLSRIIFGGAMPVDQKKELSRRIRELNECIGQGLYQDFLPVWLGKRIPSPGMSKVKRLWKETMSFVVGRIEEHKKNFDRDNINDFVDGILLSQLEAREAGEDMSNFSDVHLKNIITDIFFAASDTSAFTMLWTFLFLAHYPDIQEKLRQQISVVAADRAVVLADRPNIPYVEAVFNEVLRLRPIVPLSIDHTALTDITIEPFGKTPKCHIPKGMIVYPNIWSCHHDPAVWGDDHDQFRPERFLTEDGTKFVKREGLVPFSVGRRQCLGEQVARQNLFLTVAGIVQRVRIKSAGDLPDCECNPLGSTFLCFPKRYKVVLEKI